MNKHIKRILIIIILFVLFFTGIEIGKNILNDSEKETTERQVNNTVQNEVINNETKSNETDNIEDKHNNELFGAYYEKAEDIMEDMTIEEKVGQIFLVRYPDEGVIQEIQNYNPGGYILFSKDFDNQTKESILQELSNCQENSKIKMIFGMDEEGGTVVRVSNHKAFRNTKFLSPQQLWNKGQLNAILEDSTEKSNLLKSIGLNMNLTPVADVPTSPSSFIYQRSYGRGAEKTSIYVSRLVETMNKDNMISTLKHFPGYGDNVDTHTGIAIDKRDYQVFENSDFLPFKSGIESKVPTILVSHNIVESMDKEYPASLSKNVHDILRNELNFSGVIMTDDLAMDAVKNYVENGEAAVQAVLAGNDIIISSDFITQRNEILQAIKNNKISEEQINMAVKRVLALKCEYEIIK